VGFEGKEKEMKRILEDGVKKLQSKDKHTVKIEVSLDGSIAIAYETLRELFELSGVGTVADFNKAILSEGLREMTGVSSLMNMLPLIKSVQVIKLDSMDDLLDILKKKKGGGRDV
jgi:hypothetical protein